ncbi:glycosyltransferase family 4 protein [Acidobacteria bacterium AH-259-D05]|nr:glycosyltransferase family 4 protein [Acidobacteria bacterium AH-259-D05]
MLQLAAGLDQDQFEPLVVFTEDGPMVEFAREMNVPIEIVRMPSAFFYSTLAPLSARRLWSFVRYYRQSVARARHLASRIKADLVHLNTSVLLPVAVGVKQTSTPIVWHLREPAGPNPVLRHWHANRITSLSEHIIASSEYVARDYVGRAPVTVIHNALDNGHFGPPSREVRERVRGEFNLAVNAPVVGVIGAVQAIKGHYFLTEAAPFVVKNLPAVRFLVIAGGVGEDYARTAKGRVKRLFDLPLDNLERMQRLVRQLGLDRHFVFAGFRRDIPEMIAAMDVLVFPSLVQEGFGRPLIEAMAMSCPVVATDIGPTREVVGEEAAVLVRPGDEQGLACALLDVLRDRGKAKRIGNAGRCRFLERFEMTAMQTKLRHVYEQVLGHGRASAGG